MRGFSLVELSIVLVILGLLTGGILAGQNLIRAAELRSVSTEYQNIITATQTFRDKYFALPGDMRNATDFWGEAASGTACATTQGTGTQTCNGDGNGKIEYPTGSNERFRYWQHLANAGLIEGSYTGIGGAGSAAWDGVLAQNIPRSKLGNSGWFAWNYIAPGDVAYTANDYGNILQFGAKAPTTGTRDPVLTPEEAWNIDTKMDDGLPQQGKVWAIWWDTCTTAASNSDLTGEYLLSDSATRCALNFQKVF